MTSVKIYTDGSCNAKSRLGGYGVYIVTPKDEIVLRQGYSNTTTARMEMRAILTALRAITTTVAVDVLIVSDSQFIVNAFHKRWLNKWRLNGWVGVANADLWRAIVREISLHPQMRLRLRWFRGHQDDSIVASESAYGNVVADALADYKTQDNYIVDKDEM